MINTSGSRRGRGRPKGSKDSGQRKKYKKHKPKKAPRTLPDPADGSSSSPEKRPSPLVNTELDGQPMSKKMRESLALNQASSSSSSSESEFFSEEEKQPLAQAQERPNLKIALKGVPARSLAANDLPAVPADTKLYCICRSPHDDVSEMIGCDAPDCRLEWFHFECVGIMVAPTGDWYCPECSKRYNIH